ncbi:MAG: hypothetical protein V7708_00835 [Oceanicoccus sp.]
MTMKYLSISLSVAILAGCDSIPMRVEADKGVIASKPIFEKYENVYACSERFATDKFLYMNNSGDIAKVRFFGHDYIGDYESKDLQRSYWFGSHENLDSFRYLVVIETDAKGFLYDFSKTTSPDEEITPSRNLSCIWRSI